LFFDLNGVLVKTSKLKAFKKLGMEAIGYPNLKSRFIEFMNFIDENKSEIMFQGQKFPTFLCEWQKGNKTCKETTDFIASSAEKNLDFFKSKTEQKLIKKSAEFFLPENHVEINKPINSMIHIVKQCKNKKDKKGNPINTVFLTSNFDKETFELIKKAFPQISDLFDEDKIIISAEIKQIKPDKEFYLHIIDKFKLKKEECTLVDDTLENAQGARSIGINAIHHRNTYQTLKELKKIKAL
jgi:FMN phosphatase YigB (HAD superfamily)